MITLQFSSSKLIGSRILEYATWSWASHVDGVLPNGKLLGSLALENGGGVKVHDMKPLNKYSRVERYTIDAPESVIERAKTQLGKPYDWAGIAAFVTHNRDWMDEDSWFCSELWAWAFEMEKFPLVRGVAFRVTPDDLLMSVRLVYQPVSEWVLPQGYIMPA